MILYFEDLSSARRASTPVRARQKGVIFITKPTYRPFPSSCENTSVLGLIVLLRFIPSQGSVKLYFILLSFLNDTENIITKAKPGTSVSDQRATGFA